VFLLDVTLLEKHLIRVEKEFELYISRFEKCMVLIISLLSNSSNSIGANAGFPKILISSAFF
jgi:hypothetical protein